MNRERMTDDVLLAMLRETPEQGFAAIVRQYGGYVYTIAASKLSGTGTVEDIEEAVSDVFVLFYKWMQTHETDSICLRAVLAVIAKRHCINRYYALMKHPAAESFETLLTEPRSSETPPDTQVLLMQAVQQLGEPDSEIVLRRYYFGQSSKQIGAALGIKPNTVDQKLSRSLKKLREMME